MGGAQREGPRGFLIPWNRDACMVCKQVLDMSKIDSIRVISDLHTRTEVPLSFPGGTKYFAIPV